jgi:hypothetical protein
MKTVSFRLFFLYTPTFCFAGFSSEVGALAPFLQPRIAHPLLGRFSLTGH